MTAIGPGPHHGEFRTHARTLDDAVATACAEIGAFVSGREVVLTTRSEPLAYTMAGEILTWRVDVEWAIK